MAVGRRGEQPVSEASLMRLDSVFIVAEAGVNHNGSLDLAKRLIDVAAEAGADAVKFQTFRANRLASPAAPKAGYQLQTTDSGESQYQMLKRLELSREAHYVLKDYCSERNIVFLSTPFDEESADLLEELKVPLYKLGSGEVTNWPLLRHIACKGKPVILSTGMSFLSEVEEAVRILRDGGCPQIVLLHCVTNYPADAQDANLKAIQTMALALQIPVGYSDHTVGVEVAIAAVAVGARVIEKHFTLDRSLSGPDHRASLEPEELKSMVSGIRTVERALGSGLKIPARSELENRTIVRRSLAASVEIPEGTILAPHLLKGLRPATGISPNFLEQIVGRKAKRSLQAGELIKWSDLA